MILRRYINLEVLRTTFALMLVLLLIFMSQRVIRYLADAVAGKINADVVFSLLGLYSPVLLSFLLPLAFFLGLLLAFGRLYVDNEMTVMRSVGVGEWHLIKALMPAVIILAIAGGAMTLFLAPWAQQQQVAILEEQKSASELAFLQPGRFRVTADKRGVMYVENVDPTAGLSKVFFAQLPEHHDQSIEANINLIVSQTGSNFFDEKTGLRYLVLDDGAAYQVNKANSGWTVTDFEQYFMRGEERRAAAAPSKVKALSSGELFGSDDPERVAELHWRLSVPISLPILLLMAVPLSRVQPRQGKFAKILPAVALYMLYLTLMIVTRNAMEDGKIPTTVGFWWIHIVALMFGLWLNRTPKPKKIPKSRAVVA